MNDEYASLLRDLNFFRMVPKNFNCGFFLIEVEGLKSSLISAIEKMILRFNGLYGQTVSNLLTKNTKIFEEFISKLTKEPKTIEEYIEMKSYINGQPYKQNCEELVEDMNLLNQCISTIENNYIAIPEKVIENSYVSSSWITKLEITKKSSEMKLEEMRPKIKKILEDRKNKIFEEYELLKKQIKSFSEYYNLGEAFDISNTSKEIYSCLKRLIEKGRAINGQEEYLKFQKSSFGYVQTLLDDFDKYHNLWDFAEKWKFVKFGKCEFLIKFFKCREVKIG